MTADVEGKALILCDNLKLGIVLEVYLRPHFKATIWSDDLRTPAYFSPEPTPLKLIVVALSSSVNDAVVALSRAQLTRHLGVVPLLIISDRPFRPDPDQKIYHLNFPFTADQLTHSVRQFLPVQ